MTKVHSSVRGTIIASLFALLATAIPMAARAAEAAGTAGASPEVERAAVAGDWNSVSQLLGKATGQLPAVSRMLKAHAYLAANHSNAALCLLLDTSAPADLQGWAAWTERQLKQNPKSPAAAYLRGDALARLKRWPEADKAFAEAARAGKKELDVLIRVAQATAQAGQKDWKVDSVASFGLGEAIKRNEPLAELYTTHGYLLLLNPGSDAAKARQDFERANELSQKAENSPSISALHGLAFAKAMLGQWDDARQDLKAAAALDIECKNTMAPLLAGAEAILGNAWTEVSMRAIAATAKANVRPGANLQEKAANVMKVFAKLPAETQQQITNVLHHEYKSNQYLESASLKSFTEYGIQIDRTGVSPYGKMGLRSETELLHQAKTNVAVMGNLLNDIRDKHHITPQAISDLQAREFSKSFFRAMPGGVKSDPVCGSGVTPTLGGSCLVPTHDEMKIIPWFEYLYSPGRPVTEKADTTASGSPKP